jgi:hypothetical protein
VPTKREDGQRVDWVPYRTLSVTFRLSGTTFIASYGDLPPFGGLRCPILAVVVVIIFRHGTSAAVWRILAAANR